MRLWPTRFAIVVEASWLTFSPTAGMRAAGQWASRFGRVLTVELLPSWKVLVLMRRGVCGARLPIFALAKSPLVSPHHKHEQSSKTDRERREEMDRDLILDMLVQEGLPGLGRWLAIGGQKSGDRSLRDLDPQLQ